MMRWNLCLASAAARFGVVLAVLSVLAPLHARCQTIPQPQRLTQMYHTTWTVREGAPSNINTSAQTTDGYLWLATDDGLFRFSGSKFESYHPTTGQDFLPGLVQSLLSMPDGGLWISYSTGEMSFLKNGHNVNYGPREGTPRGNITAFAMAPDGSVWAASVGGLMRFRASHWEHVEKEFGYQGTFALSVYFDRRDTLWVGTGKELLYLPRGEHTFHVALAAKDDTYTVAESPDGRIWVALNSSAAIRLVTNSDGTLLKKQVVISGYKTQGLFFSRDGSGWIPTDNDGLYRIPSSAVRSQDPADWHRFAEHLSSADGLTSNYVYPPTEDSEGSVWFPTSKGVDQFRPSALNKVAVPMDYERVVITSDGANGMIAAGTGGKYAIHAFEDGTTKIMKGPAGIYCAYRDSQGVVWLGGTGGLWKSVGKAFVAVPLPAGIEPENNIPVAVTKGPQGDLYAYFLRKGIFRLQNGVWTQPAQFVGFERGSSSVEVTDGAGRIWFGQKLNQISIYDGRALTRYGPESGVSVGTVSALYSHNNQMWVGGELGLQYFRRNRFETLQFAGPTPVTGISGIVQTSNGDLWLNAAPGVVLVPSGEVVHAEADATYKAQTKVYNYLDGLVGTAHQIRPTPSVLEDADGRLWFATRTGLAWLDPAHLAFNTKPPAIFISSIEANGLVFRDPERLTLPVHAKNLQFSYTATSLAIPERVHFRYKLEGFDTEWQDAGTRRQAFYSALPPGAYRFVVTACNNDGVWNKTGAATALTIPPSFLQSDLFKILCSVALIGLLGVIYRLRIRSVTNQVKVRLYERMTERERIARDLHDTFFQGIQGLLLRFNTGTAQLKQDEPAKLILEEALQMSDRVMLEGRELVLDLRTGIGTIQSLATALADAGAELKKTREASFKVSVQGEQRELHPVVFEEVHRIGREALTNAFRHSQANTIEAEINFDSHELRLRVRDNGTGLANNVLAKGSLQNHWGLPGMRERSQKIGAHIDIWSRKGAGTEIELRVPATVAYRSVVSKQRFGSLGRLWQSDTESYD